MSKLFIDKEIEIKAPAAKVWEVLTKREYSDLWTTLFDQGMFVQSDWKMDSPVLWKERNGKTVVEGNVTKVDPPKFLRFTVFDVETGRMPVSQEDGMTFELVEFGDKTKLHLLHGDFSVMSEGEKYYKMTLDVWEKALPKIKELAQK